MVYTIQLRHDESVDWDVQNPILKAGEPGFEQDTNKLKLGDGLTRWNELPYIEGDDTSNDDGPSFELLYQNAKV